MIKLQFRVVRTIDADGNENVVEGERSFSTWAELKTFIVARVDAGDLADLEKLNLTVWHEPRRI